MSRADNRHYLGRFDRPRDIFLAYVRQNLLQIAAGVTLAAAGSFAAVQAPRLIGAIFDDLGRRAPYDHVVQLSLGVIGLTLLEVLFRGFGRFNILSAGRTIEFAMRGDLFGHLQRMHLGYFQHQRTGDLMARMTNDLSIVRQMNSMGIMGLTSTTMTLLFTVLAMLTVDVRLTLIAVALLPIATVAFTVIGRRVHVLFEALQEQFGDLATRAQENFSGIRVVKAFSQEEAEIGQFQNATEEYARRAVHLELFNGLMWPVMGFINGLGVLVVLYVGGQDAISGGLSIGQLVQFVGYVQLMSIPMTMLGDVMNTFQQGWASLGRLRQLYNAVPAIDEPEDAVTAPIRGDVEMRGVTFAYNRTIVLRDISFTVPAGGSLAIVGATGAGKSSLVNLVPRLFDVQQGEVLIDGVDVRRYPLRTLRRAIGYVPQETFLFSVPLRENVGFGLEKTLTADQLEWAGDVSQLNKDVLDFPAKYDTMLGERGVTLSGGQKQRSAIARAVAKDPRILILDDALSSVDTFTEAEILRRLRGVMRDRTSIIVAHRISTVKDADEILVLDDGRIAERGSHRDLLERNGLYAQMYRRQLLEEELEVDEEQEEHERRIRSEHLDEPEEAPRSRLGGLDLGGMS